MRLLEVCGINWFDIEDKFEKGAGNEGGREVCGEVMMEEELSTHEIEREVVSCPAEEEEAGRIVETRSRAWAPDWG